MKIKCKKCGKHFDPDMYSGLCPKCGTYNGAHMADTDVSQYLSGGNSAEKAHEQLHERYGDTGHDAQAHRELHEAYDNGYEAAHPAYDLQKEGDFQDGTASKKRISGLTVVLAALLVIIPLVSMVSYQLWERQKIRNLLSGEIGQAPLQDGNTLVFSGEHFEAPVTVTVLGTGIAKDEELSSAGKMLFLVLADASSERYSFDVRLSRVALKYERDGKIFYQGPADYYDMEEYLPRMGLTKEELLTTYGIGNGEEQKGYWIFCVDEDAENTELLLMAQDEDSVIVQEGTVPLDPFDRTELLIGEVAP